MSKTIDTLKKSSFKEDVLRNHIADTYFYQKSRPKTPHKARSRRKNKLPELKLIAKTAFTVSALAAVAALIAAMSVMGAKHLDRAGAERAKARISGMDVVAISLGGRPNREIIKRLEFRGFAKNRESRAEKSEISFVNPEKFKWADMSIGFRFPVDFSARTLRISLRGDTGGEKVCLVLRDADNRSARISDLSVSSKWSSKSLRLDAIGRDIDLSRIAHLRIESGSVGEASKDDDPKIPFRIYVKDISISKETFDGPRASS